MHDSKILKFMYKLYHNELPIYFDNYRPFLEKIETPYNLRPAPLPVPQVTHVYAEDMLVYKPGMRLGFGKNSGKFYVLQLTLIQYNTASSRYLR